MDGLPLLNKKPKWSGLEAEAYRLLKKHGVSHQRILVACSGGLDSMVLLTLLGQIGQALKLHLTVAHIHHGTTSDQRLLSFRNKALKFVSVQAQKMNIPFVELTAKREVSGEAGLRDLRYKGLKVLLKKTNSSMIALAHHEDDLLETRLIRLIRGVGVEGIPSMAVLKGGRLRPLLHFSRRELRAYALEKKIDWCEDPSNKDEGPLRNWVRAQWLPLLENKRKGARQTLARSLQNLSEKTASSLWAKKYFNERGVLRGALLELNHQEKRQVIASYLNSKAHQNYSLAHIEELLKRVESPAKSLSFRLSHRQWEVNAEYIEII